VKPGMKTVAIVGGGPIGLEAALRLTRAGFRVTVYEAGRAAEHFARYGPVRLFTPFRMNSTELGREALRGSGARLPDAEEALTAAELRERYLLPLASLPELAGVLREGLRVTGIAREGLVKGQAQGRGERPFLLRLENPVGEGMPLDRADVAIDASGVFASPQATGPGGLPALGEGSLGSRLERHLPDLAGGARLRFAGQRILLVGDGRSAANALADLDDVVRVGGVGGRTRVEWVHRDRGDEAFSPVPRAELDELPVLRELHERTARVARTASWIRHHAGASILSYRSLPSGAVEVTLQNPGGSERTVEVDRVLALVGYRPDLDLVRELRVHLCYGSEAPMALAAALEAAPAEGCLAQVSHGPESLRNPEPGFFILGAKSYGRNPRFLLRIGHRQIEDLMTLLGAPAPVSAGGA
jgi:FAD dependent oxidoreductase